MKSSFGSHHHNLRVPRHLSQKEGEIKGQGLSLGPTSPQPSKTLSKTNKSKWSYKKQRLKKKPMIKLVQNLSTRENVGNRAAILSLPLWDSSKIIIHVGSLFLTWRLLRHKMTGRFSRCLFLSRVFTFPLGFLPVVLQFPLPASFMIFSPSNCLSPLYPSLIPCVSPQTVLSSFIQLF